MMKSSVEKNRGFTLLEMLVVVLIIGILSTLSLVTYNKVNRQNRDSTRVSDISQLQVALAAYKRDLNVYPSVITAGQEIRGTGSSTTTLYMAKVPTPPTPSDGDCGNYPLYTSYYYLPSSNAKSYCLFFCLGGATSDLAAGAKIAKPSGIVDGALGINQCY